MITCSLPVEYALIEKFSYHNEPINMRFCINLSMYIPTYNLITDKETIYEFLFTYNFGILNSYDLEKQEILTTHLPFVITTEDEKLTLYCHFAKANNHWKSLLEYPKVKILFSGPHAYISPRYYINKTVPTWNYTTIHVSGYAEILHSELEEKKMIFKLVEQMEGDIESGGWRTDELDEGLVNALLKGTKSAKISVTTLEAKFKLNQNKTPEDQQNVIKNLQQKGYPERELAQFMDKHLFNTE